MWLNIDYCIVLSNDEIMLVVADERKGRKVIIIY